MKRITLTIAGIIMATSSYVSMASMSYECWAYVGGHPDKMVHVSANDSSEARAKAERKFRDLGIKADYVKCK